MIIFLPKPTMYFNKLKLGCDNFKFGKVIEIANFSPHPCENSFAPFTIGAIRFFKVKSD